MKKIISTVLVCLLLVGSLLTLASCGKMITGKYEYDGLLRDKTIEFGMFGKVTLTVDPELSDKEYVYEGKYELNEAGDKITLTFEDADAEEFCGTFDFEQVSSSTDGDYIRIGIEKYEKDN